MDEGQFSRVKVHHELQMKQSRAIFKVLEVLGWEVMQCFDAMSDSL
jgi:hypothetical protein